MWHKPCRTFHPWCLCIKTRCLFIYIAEDKQINFHTLVIGALSIYVFAGVEFYHTSINLQTLLISNEQTDAVINIHRINNRNG